MLGPPVGLIRGHREKKETAGGQKAQILNTFTCLSFIRNSHSHHTQCLYAMPYTISSSTYAWKHSYIISYSGILYSQHLMIRQHIASAYLKNKYVMYYILHIHNEDHTTSTLHVNISTSCALISGPYVTITTSCQHSIPNHIASAPYTQTASCATHQLWLPITHAVALLSKIVCNAKNIFKKGHPIMCHICCCSILTMSLFIVLCK